VARQAVVRRAAQRPAGPAVRRRQPAASRAAAGSFPDQKASCPVEAASCPAAVARPARHWAMLTAVAARQEVSVPDASVAVRDVSAGRFRQAALPAPDAFAVPLREAVEEAEVAALDAPRRVAAVASDAAAVPRPAAGAASDAMAVRPQEAAAARDGEVAAEAGAAPHAAAVPREAVARAVAAVRRVAEAVRAAAVRRQAEVQDAAAAAALPSAVAWACRQGRLRPAVPQSTVRLAKVGLAKVRPAKARLASVRSVLEARAAHAMRCLQMVSRSARLLQAAQDGIWSWRSLFLESLL
jgi:hypothetical protein